MLVDHGRDERLGGDVAALDEDLAEPPPGLALDVQRLLELGFGDRAAVDEHAPERAPRLDLARPGRRGGSRRLGLGVLEAQARLLDQDPRQLRVGERALGDEDLAELPAAAPLLGKRRLELAREDEPALDEVLAERPPREAGVRHAEKIDTSSALL